MKRGFPATLITALAILVLASPVAASPYTTVQRTIQDRDGDNLLEYAPGEDHVFPLGEPVGEGECKDGPGEEYRLPHNCSIVNVLQLSDFQMVDEESPGRVEFFDTTQRGPFNPLSAAYRPQESLTTQVTEAMVRQARNTVSPATGNQLDLTILTGDNADSQQYNETRWFIDILDGTGGSENPDPEMETPPNTNQDRKVDPNSGIPVSGCEATPGSVYDGVRDNGEAGPGDPGPAYYEPDATRPRKDDGDGYSPNRARNRSETGRDVTVRDFPELLEDANEPFEAIGLDMPWYSAFGNHDALVQGNDPNAYFGPGGPLNPVPNAAQETSNPVFQAIVTGCVKPQSATVAAALAQFISGELGGLGESPPQSAIEDAQKEAQEQFGDQEDAGQAALVPPDERRCYLAKDEPNPGAPAPCNTTAPNGEGGWIGQHFRTTGTPAGHGFERRPLPARANNDGYYSFSPKPGLRFIVLDTVTDECGAEFCSEGSLDNTQFEWLRTELKNAAGAGEYAVVFGHHTLRTMRQTTTDATEAPFHYGQRVDRENPPNPQNPATLGDSVEELFCQRPNVLAYVAGHEHDNVVEHYECAKDQPSPTPGPGDFWEVGTAAHIDWPQQSRMIELVDTGGQIAMVLTMLDHAGPAYPGGPQPTCAEDTEMASSDRCGQAGDQLTRLGSIARELTYNDYQQSRGSRGDRDDRNVIVPLGRPFPCSEEAGQACEPPPAEG